jgi:undecaprenyl-diphosphatase
LKAWTIATLALLVLLFLWLGWTGGPANAFDCDSIATLAAIRHRSPALTSTAILVTRLGGAWITLSLTVIAGLLLWWRGARGRALALIITVACGRLAADGLKLLYERPRPAIDLHPVLTSSSSYPSGHAANSMVSFVALALFAAPPRHRPFAIAAAIGCSILVGMTRPFLGVHWPSDMIGGWALGAIVLIVAFAAARNRLAPAEQQHQIVGRHPPHILKR